MTSATVNISHTPSQQPFLKELLAKHEVPSKIELPSSSEMDNEETPQKRDIELVLTRGDTASTSLTFNESLAPKDQASPPNLLLRREESDATSELSYDSSEGDSINSIFSSGKLYGRTEEEAILAEALDRITQRKAPRRLEYVLISGGSGTGKTRLSETLRQRVNSKGGYFCSGKFDQQQADPFAPLCAAFTDYVKQVIREPDDVVREVRQRIRSALEGDMCAMIKMIPSLADLMDDGMYTEEDFQCARRCNDKQGRSIFAMHKLMRAICSPERPVVFMIDDLQWASSCPLRKLRCMVLDDMNDGILLLGICRDNVSPNSALSSFLRELEDQQVDITNIHVNNLELTNIVEMTNELFLMPQEQTESLAKFVFDHSNGNAYVAIECIRLLQQESRMLQYDEKSKIWSVNDDICDEMMTYCPATFMEGKLRTLPRNIQKVFMVCSCLGSNITEHLVQIALQEPVEERFKQIVKKGKLVYNESRKTYSFRHNSFQTACYDLITEELQPALHLEIGMRLWKHLDEKEVDKKLFVILNQLKRGATLMSDQSMRYEVAALCIRAAEKAAVLFSFPTASDQLKFACSLLGLNHWEEAYDLSLVLYNYAAEVEFSLADSARVDYLLNEVLEHARDFSDKIRAYSTQVYMYGVRGKADRAIETGKCVLKTLGVHLKPQCHKLNLAWSMSRIDRKLQGKSDESIKRLPHMTDPNKLAAMQILNMLFLNTYIARRDLYPFVVLKMMKLTLTDGLSAISSVAFAGYGTLLCFAGQIEEGMRYGKIALDLVDEFDAQSFQSRVGALVWGTIIVHRRPWKDSLEQLQEGHRLGLQTGDTEFAMMNANLYVHFMIDSGMFRLSETIAHAKEIKALTELHGHSKQLAVLHPFVGFFQLFMDPNADLLDHSGGVDDGLESAKANQNAFALSVIYSIKVFLYFVAGDYDASIKTLEDRYGCLTRMEGSIHETFVLYLGGLIFFSVARRATNAREKRKLLKRARRCMRLLKGLAKQNPATCLGKYVLLEAENASLAKKDAVAKEKYEHAIALAAKYGSYFEVAFANQVAGEHYTHLNDIERGLTYFKESCKTYDDWGALAAVTHLKKKIVAFEKITNAKV